MRWSLSNKSAHILILALIISRLDCSNAVLHGVTIREQNRASNHPQSICTCSVTEFQIPGQLHIPSWQSLLATNQPEGAVQGDPHDMEQHSFLVDRQSTSRNCVCLCPSIICAVVCDHYRFQWGFAVSGPSEWDRLPTAMRILVGDGVTTVFQSQLKTFLFWQ